MKGSIKKLIPWIIVIIALTITVLIIVFSNGEVSKIGETLASANYLWVLAAFGLLFGYMFLNAIPLYIFGKTDGGDKISFGNSQLIGGVEYFFDAVTPFNSGGQPFQVYCYSRIGVKPSRSTGIMLMNFVCFQTALVILCGGSLFFYNELTASGNELIPIMMIVGLSMNTFILFLFCSVGLSSHIARFLTRIVKWICGWKIWKGKLEGTVYKFEQYCVDAQATFQKLLKHRFRFFIAIVLKGLSLIVFYAIPYFIFLALDINVGVEGIPSIVAMTTFAIAMTCYIPTPGATGGVEFAFKELFKSLIIGVVAVEAFDAVASSGMLLWRLVAYYSLMIISLIIYIVFIATAKNPYDKEPQVEKETSDSTQETANSTQEAGTISE